ncbi:MAG: 4-alpha-glucanotransferase [Candidatus Cloacimonadota bacterium]|nr:4-alpha-glucanotransferase [Candidatus Cloacimonadota bacterium]
MNFERSSGVLLHITSLPGKYGIGDLGEETYDFVDFLANAKQKLWQILPTGPTGYGDSPYQTFSAFAGNSLFIDLDNLLEKRILLPEDLVHDFQFNDRRVEYKKVREFKEEKLQIAFNNFDITNTKFTNFIAEESWWLDDFALFMSLKEHFNGKAWNGWDEGIKLHQQNAVDYYCDFLNQQINYHKFCQFIFFEQWAKLKKYTNKKGVKIIGDIPIYISADSSDAWANSQLFQFDENNVPTKVAGVPPDYFSKTGQLWGNPLYDWKVLEEQNFTWWIDRFKAMQKQVDIMRLDHFRGFEAYWAVSAGENTAINGEWQKAPGEKFFEAVLDELGEIPIIAEDLGIITKEVENLRDKFEFPGMKILQFAFDSDMENNYLPHKYKKNCVVYTGTHDNETTLGWFKNSSTERKELIKTYLQKEEIDICWDMLEIAWKSKADIAVAPMQDFLCLDNVARMNIPGKPNGNWQWRVTKEQLSSELTQKIKNLTKQSNR